MAGNWGAIFIDMQRIGEEQNMVEEEIDIGDDTEYHVEYMLQKEDTIAIAGLTNHLPSRINHHPWLLQVRNTAIDNIVRAGGPFGVRKITVYTAMIYVDRFLSSMPIKSERFETAKLLAMACLHLACEQLEQDYHKPKLSKYEEFAQCGGESILNMKNSVVAQFRSVLTFVTPIHFVKYFMSKFCRDLSRKEYVRVTSVELIMETLGDEKLMSQKAFVVGAAATLVASFHPKTLTEKMIEDEINALPTKWLIPLNEVCSCYNRLSEIHSQRIDN